jgi:putative transposase
MASYTLNAKNDYSTLDCRRRVLHFNISDAPTAGWTAQQVVQVFPFTTPPRYLLRDRDSIYGADFVRRVESLGLEQKLIAPQSPWQNPVVERLIGSLRRECLDHIIVFNQEHLRRVLTDYLGYYYRHRTHRSLEQDCPEPRAVEPPDQGNIVEPSQAPTPVLISLPIHTLSPLVLEIVRSM